MEKEYTFYVCLLAYGRVTRDRIAMRPVRIPREVMQEAVELDDILEAIFDCGQNDVQPYPNTPSVSVGDMIMIPKCLNDPGSMEDMEYTPPESGVHGYVVETSGFRLVGRDEYSRLMYEAIERERIRIESN